ncbi:MAG TPA: GNAT family N-acetyltransferase [Deltaproteobacteria bacterium]|nr:GNAT family N-acetyltransferase [Deltaproteobacteria bacterium]
MKLDADLIKLNEPLIVSEYNTDQIHNWSNREQNNLKREIKVLLEVVYPKMPDDELKIWSCGFFKQHDGDAERRVLTIRNSTSALIGAALYDIGTVCIESNRWVNVYLISITILPPYQGHGIGKAIVKTILDESSPNIFLSSCTQSDMLHCCISIVRKRLVTGYDVFPYLNVIGSDCALVTASRQKVPFAKEAFRQIYLNLTGGDMAEVESALANLTDTLVRKNMFVSRFAFDPWAKDGRRDFLAQALGLKNGDGILVILTKRSGDVSCSNTFI